MLSSFDDLPDDVLTLVGSYLDVKSNVHLSMVNKRTFRRFNASYWQNIFVSRWNHDSREMFYQVYIPVGSFSTSYFVQFCQVLEAAFLGLGEVRGAYRRQEMNLAESFFTTLFWYLQPSFVGRGLGTMKEYHVRNNWKKACVLRESGRHLRSCHICGELAPETQQNAFEEAMHTHSSPWVKPCSCDRLVHRTCLERRIGHPALGRTAISLDDRARINELNLEQYDFGSCEDCGHEYRHEWRLPNSLRELVRVSLQTSFALERTIRCLCIWVVASVIILWLDSIFTVDIWPKDEPLLSIPLNIFTLLQIVLLDIFLSPRFLAIVNHIWNGPVFAFYWRLYLYFVMAVMLIIITFSPISPYHATKLPMPLFVFSYLNALCYLAVSLVVIVIFWKTHYRVITVADSEPLLPGDFSHPMYMTL